LPVDIRAAFDISNSFHLLRISLVENVRCRVDIATVKDKTRRKTAEALDSTLGVSRSQAWSLCQIDRNEHSVLALMRESINR
jgi:hypothetical protein